MHARSGRKVPVGEIPPPTHRSGTARMVTTWRRGLQRELRAAARPVQGFDARSYLGSPVPVLGVRAPDLHRIAREFDVAHRPIPLPVFLRLAGALWKGNRFEERILAIELLTRRRRQLDDKAWGLLDGWVDDVSGWGLTDSLAGGLLSSLVPGHPDRYQDLLRWSRSPDAWRRRASLYALARTIREGDLDRAYRLIDPLRADPERWVQRAVGTWLRGCWTVDPARARRYLLRRGGELPPVALTVALEHATGAERSRIRAVARRAALPRRSA